MMAVKQIFALLLLLVLLGVLTIAIRRERRLLTTQLTRPVDELSTAHFGYLAEGPHRAVEASLTFLHKSGAVEIQGAGWLRRLGEPPAAASPWDQAVLRAADGTQAEQVTQSQGLTPSLRTLRLDLTRWGYLISDEVKHKANLYILLIGLLVLCGIPAAVQGAVGKDPICAIGGGAVILGSVVLSISLTGHSRLTREGRKALKQLRKRHDHLQPRHKPAWQTYGPETAAVGVAIFGGPVMWDCDPELARAAGIRRPGDTYSDSGSCGGDGGCGD